MKNTLFGYFAVIIFISCGNIIKPQEIDFKKNRVFDTQEFDVEANSKPISKEHFLNLRKPSHRVNANQFNDFYQIYDGESHFFIAKKNANNVQYLDVNTGNYAPLKITDEAPFGLVIGQSKTHIYYYHGSSRGTKFNAYALSSHEIKTYAIKNFVVIRVAALLDHNTLLANGVYTKDGKARLGFYIIDLNKSEVSKTLLEDVTEKTPNGDPSTFGGYYYSYGKNHFFVYNKKDGIYHFTSDGKYVRTLKTPDTFNFPGEKGPSSGNRSTDNLHNNLFVQGNTLYVLLNVLTNKGKTLLFDTYDLQKGTYAKTQSLNLKVDPSISDVSSKIVYQEGNIINIILPNKSESDQFLHQTFNLQNYGNK